jgi:hypothetical protein
MHSNRPGYPCFPHNKLSERPRLVCPLIIICLISEKDLFLSSILPEPASRTSPVHTWQRSLPHKHKLSTEKHCHSADPIVEVLSSNGVAGLVCAASPLIVGLDPTVWDRCDADFGLVPSKQSMRLVIAEHLPDQS